MLCNLSKHNTTYTIQIQTLRSNLIKRALGCLPDWSACRPGSGSHPFDLLSGESPTLRAISAGLGDRRRGDIIAMDRLSPNRTSFASIALERGKTQNTAFEDWSNKVWRFNAVPGAEVELKDFRKDVRIELLNEAGQIVLAYNLYRCWPFFCEPLSHLDANANLIAVETMTLACEGWECDVSIVEPAEPSSAKPPAR